ncbi:MAG TPA: hypothetical protein VES20_11810, partial [Bryobacteraceae bacterium]|nr:hypothetical protein [Bryobacteraceae bacterium]
MQFRGTNTNGRWCAIHRIFGPTYACFLVTHVYGRSGFVYGANSRSTSDDVASLTDDETVVAAEFLERALQPIGGPQ